MPAWGRRQSYPAVVGTTIAFVVVFGSAALLRPLIPEPDPNPIVARRGEFMQNASRQVVRWRSLEDRPFAEAKRTDRLVFLVVGSAWSWTGRQIDKYILSENEIAERLNRDFVPVRIDSTFRPEWESGPIPLSAASTGSDLGWYVLITRPDGTPISWLARNDAKQSLELQNFSDLLASAQRSKLADSPVEARSVVGQMNTEAPFLAGTSTAQGGSMGGYVNGVAERAKSFFSEGGIYSWHPWEWRLLMSQGMTGETSAGLTPLLQSPKVDWLYGGLFRTAMAPNAFGVKYDKVAIENAEMASTLAILANKTGDPFIKSVARRTFDFVLKGFIKETDVSGFEYLDEIDQGRNARYSLKPSLMRRRFTSEDQSWLKRFLGLDVGVNPAMTVRVASPSDFDRESLRYDGFFGRIRSILGDSPTKKGGSDLLSNIAGVSARLTETARILGDSDRLKRALAFYPTVLKYRVGTDGVVRTLNATPDSVAFLGDFLAMADAELQNFLVTGDVSAIESGRLILNRAKEIFGSETEGVLRTIPLERCVPEAHWVALPNVVDRSQGSLTGAYVRLAQAYSLIYRDTKNGEVLRENALTTTSRYAPLTKRLGFRLGALAHGMALITRDEAFFVVGSQATQTALRLAAGSGETLVIPVEGSLRKDLQKRGPGIYLTTRGQTTGPWSEADAREMMLDLP